MPAHFVTGGESLAPERLKRRRHERRITRKRSHLFVGPNEPREADWLTEIVSKMFRQLEETRDTLP